MLIQERLTIRQGVKYNTEGSEESRQANGIAVSGGGSGSGRGRREAH